LDVIIDLERGLVRFVPIKWTNATLAIARQQDYLDWARE
jgi:hypothetical protein